eukprot:TRINITY_DN9004_c0_g1_i3.p1 TRINITY_DN9004_c0_g1~~TRINITY_DN9004_c0_g1_i3.p1  ORF type:complete len:106 (+),score=11.98 TRINITY_DN9004_c0_g1_i3:714-1031(+)
MGRWKKMAAIGVKAPVMTKSQDKVGSWMKYTENGMLADLTIAGLFVHGCCSHRHCFDVKYQGAQLSCIKSKGILNQSHTKLKLKYDYSVKMEIMNLHDLKYLPPI